MSQLEGFQGFPSCIASGSSACRLFSVALGTSGFTGTYGLSQLVQDAIIASGRRRLGSITLSLQGRASRTLTVSNLSDPLAITNPVLCLELGQGILFDLPNGKTSYPVYLKDSFLNTNPRFDYGAFRTLAALAASRTAQVCSETTFGSIILLRMYSSLCLRHHMVDAGVVQPQLCEKGRRIWFMRCAIVRCTIWGILFMLTSVMLSLIFYLFCAGFRVCICFQ